MKNKIIIVGVVIVVIAVAGFALLQSNTGTLKGRFGRIGSQISVQVPPIAPSNLIAVVVNKVNVALTWIDNSNDESGFLITKALSGGTGSQSSYANANSTTHTISVSSAGTYNFTVKAYRDTTGTPPRLYSSASNTVTVTILDPPRPNDPSNLFATANDDLSVTLNWQDNSNDETGFHFLYRPKGELWTGIIPRADANATNFTISVPLFSAGMTYEFKVQAYKTVVPGWLVYSFASNVAEVTMPISLDVDMPGLMIPPSFP